MPIYEYVCNKCNKITDQFQWITKEYDTPKCQFCGHITIKIMPTIIHAKIAGEFMDNLQVGKSIQKRNEYLKRERRDDKGLKDAYKKI